jgi:hypothetical protein
VVGDVDAVAEPCDVVERAFHPHVLVVDEDDADYTHTGRLADVTC